MKITSHQVIEVLDEIHREILSENKDVQEQFHLVAKRARSLFHADSCTIYLTDPLTISLRSRGADGEISQSWVHAPRGNGLGMTVLLSGRRIWESDRQRFNPGIKDPIKRVGVFSLHRPGTHPLGVVYLHYLRDPKLDNDALKLAESFFHLVGLTIQLGAVRKDNIERIKELERLSEVGIEMFRAGEFESSLNFIATVARRAMHADCAVLFCFGDDGKDGSVHIADDKGARSKPNVPSPRKAGLTQAILKAKGGYLQVPDIDDPPREYRSLLSVAKNRMLKQPGVKAFTAFPLRSVTEPIGVLYICSRQKRVLREDELRIARILVETAAVKIQVNRVTRLRQRVVESVAIKQMSMLAVQFAHRIINLAGTLPFDINQIEGMAKRELKFDREEFLACVGKIRESVLQLRDIGVLLRQGTDIGGSPQESSVSRIVEQAFRSAQTKPHVKLVSDIPPSLPPILGIRAILVDVVGNLVNNAANAGATRICVSALHRSLDKELDITVSDNGRGMTAQQRDRVFEPEFTVTREKKRGGLHIGLWASRWQVARMGGRLSVQSSQGKGSIFIITLRVAVDNAV